MKTFLLLAMLTAAQTADAATTCVGLRSGQFYERNPLLGSSCRSVVLRKSALTLGSAFAYTWLSRKGKTRLATTLVLVPTATGAIAATLNARLIW